MFRGVQMSTTVFPSIFSCLEGVPNKVRVIGIPDCLDSAEVDICKDDCSSRDNVVRRPCRIYSEAVVPWLKTVDDTTVIAILNKGILRRHNLTRQTPTEE